MKKSYVLVMLCAMLLTGCGQTSETADNTETSTVSQITTTVTSAKKETDATTEDISHESTEIGSEMTSSETTASTESLQNIETQLQITTSTVGSDKEAAPVTTTKGQSVTTTTVTTTKVVTTKPVTTTKLTTTTVTTESKPVITDDNLYGYWHDISDRLDDPILDWTMITSQVGSFIDEGIAYEELYSIGQTFSGTDYEKALAVCEYAYSLGGHSCIEYALNAYFLGQGAGIDITIARSSKYDWYGHVANTIKLDGKWYYMEPQGNIVGSPYTYAAGGNGVSYPDGLDVTTDIYENNISVTIADDWYQ